jgi:hypothetical protein
VGTGRVVGYAGVVHDRAGYAAGGAAGDKTADAGALSASPEGEGHLADGPDGYIWQTLSLTMGVASQVIHTGKDAQH